MTCVVDDLWSMTDVVNDLCGRRPVWLSFQSTLDDLWSLACVAYELLGRWPMWLIINVVAGLCG